MYEYIWMYIRSVRPLRYIFLQLFRTSDRQTAIINRLNTFTRACVYVYIFVYIINSYLSKSLIKFSPKNIRTFSQKKWLGCVYKKYTQPLAQATSHSHLNFNCYETSLQMKLCWYLYVYMYMRTCTFVCAKIPPALFFTCYTTLMNSNSPARECRMYAYGTGFWAWARARALRGVIFDFDCTR